MKVLELYFAFAGFIGFCIIVALVAYALINCLKQQKYIPLLMLGAIIGLFLFRPTQLFILFVFSIVLTLNACCYFYFTICHFIKESRKKTVYSKIYPEVSILIPVKNESLVIESTLLSLKEIEYPTEKLSIVLLDDNSTDGTFELACAFKASMPNLTVIKNKNSLGKAKALNNYLPKIKSEYTMLLDADHITDKNFLHKVLPHFTDPEVACVQAKNEIRNGNKSLLTRLIQIEYLGRYEVIYNGKKAACFVGTGAVFSTKMLREVNGFSESMLTEDVEISLRIYQKGKKIIFDNTAATYELATEDIKNFYKQRHRWFRGILQSLFLHAPNMSGNASVPKSAKFYYLHMFVELISLATFLISCAFLMIGFIGIVPFYFKFGVYLETATVGLFSILAILKNRKPYLILYIPILIFYYLLYAIPNIAAMIDNWILKSDYQWIKTERTTHLNPFYLNLFSRNRSKSVLTEE